VILFYFAKKSPKGHTVFSKGNILLQIHLFVNFLNRQIVTENLNFFLDKGVVVRFMFDLPKFCPDKKICGK